MSEIRVHPSWEKTGGIALAIVRGEHDDELESIQNACKVRVKSMFRKGGHYRLRDTKSELDGKEVVIEKINTKSISVRLVDVGIGYNVPPRMLEAL